MVAAAFAALTAMLWPALTGKAILAFRDMLHNYGPMRELFWSGQIDLWNDREFGGSSVLADIVQQPFYLGALAMRALHAPAWPGIAIRVWMHSLGGMIGMYALLRRTTGADDPDSLTFAELGLDSARHGVAVGDDFVELTRTEYQLLELLMLNPRRVLTHSVTRCSRRGELPFRRSSSLAIRCSAA